MNEDPAVADRLSLRATTAIVTGATSGIGERAARVLHAAGATVVAVGRLTERLEKFCAELGEGCITVTAELSDPTSASAVIEAATEGLLPLKVLINVAGIPDEATALREGSELFQRVLGVNLIGVFELSVRFAAHLRETGTGGAIVNVASIFGLRASTFTPGAGSVASKAGLIGLTQELAVQWSRYGIRVNALAPGFFPSEMTVDARTPMGRPGRLDELDGPLLLLASNAGSYMTGQVLVVDGGWTST